MNMEEDTDTDIDMVKDIDWSLTPWKYRNARPSGGDGSIDLRVDRSTKLILA